MNAEVFIRLIQVIEKISESAKNGLPLLALLTLAFQHTVLAPVGSPLGTLEQVMELLLEGVIVIFLIFDWRKGQKGFDQSKLDEQIQEYSSRLASRESVFTPEKVQNAREQT